MHELQTGETLQNHEKVLAEGPPLGRMSKTEARQLISRTCCTSFVTFISLNFLPFERAYWRSSNNNPRPPASILLTLAKSRTTEATLRSAKTISRKVSVAAVTS